LYHDLKQYPAEKAWNKVEIRLSTKKVNRRFISIQSFQRVAAVVFLAVLLTAAGIFYNRQQSPTMIEIVASEEIMNNYILPDGSRVTLNTHSKLRFPEKFTGTNREVQIIGEAFFEVKPEPSHPFVITAQNAEIKVLGTSFNVIAYPGQELVEVVVESGTVQFSNSGDNKSRIILEKGEKGSLNTNSQLVEGKSNDLNYNSWKTHCLVFNASPLTEVISQLKKAYHVEIYLAEPTLVDLRLTAQFNQHSLDFILKVIESTFGIESKFENGHYNLSLRKNNH
jgi:ferric-dicitrate binding protein FerR (iron transport regulator)